MIDIYNTFFNRVLYKIHPISFVFYISIYFSKIRMNFIYIQHIKISYVEYKNIDL